MNTPVSNVKEVLPKAVVATSRLLKDESKLTAAYLVLRRSFHFLELFGILIGVQMTYTWKNNTRFVFTKFLTSFCWSQFIYTQILYVYQHKAVRTFEVFAIYGIGVSAVLKIWCFEKYHKNIRALFESTLKICQQNIGSRGERLTSRVRFNFTFLKFIASLAIFLVIIYLFYPVKSFLIDGELVPFVPIEVMFIDQSTMWGYCAVSCAMMTVGVYIAEIKNIFDDKMYIFFIFAYLSQILCMYQIRVNNWIPGYALAIGFFIEMIFYCMMGTIVVMENERSCFIIAQSTWYTYDLKSQKLILTLLNSTMNGDELWIGSIAPLSVYTATEIVKSIYTYYTVMTEVM